MRNPALSTPPGYEFSFQVFDCTAGAAVATLRVPASFAESYDARRMESSARARNSQAVDNAVDDHAPACPRCDDLLPIGSTYCAECGVRVVV